MTEWLSKKDASLEIGVSTKTLERLMSKRKISYYRGEGNSKVRFKREDVQNYIESIKVEKEK